MDGHCYGSQMEVVKQDGQVIVKTSGGGEVELQRSARDTGDGTVLVWTECLIRKPQLYHQCEVCSLKRILDLKTDMTYFHQSAMKRF
jgi:hypothetical protein